MQMNCSRLYLGSALFPSCFLHLPTLSLLENAFDRLQASEFCAALKSKAEMVITRVKVMLT